jgi:hypothetical protein
MQNGNHLYIIRTKKISNIYRKYFAKVYILKIIFFFFNFFFCSSKFTYRKWGWFGTNFSFDARLRRCRVLYYTAIGGNFLILIWTSFSPFTVGTYFCITLIFDAKNLRFLGFKFCGWFGTTAFLGELKDFDEGFFTYYI